MPDISNLYIRPQRKRWPSQRSYIPPTQKRVVGLGYNGFPKGCDDDEFPWERDGEFLKTKYPYVVHAELNAILNSIQDLNGCTIYVSLFPCNECAKAIIQSGIRCVVYESDKYNGTDENIASKMMFRDAGVELVQLTYETSVDVQVNRSMTEAKDAAD